MCQKPLGGEYHQSKENRLMGGREGRKEMGKGGYFNWCLWTIVWHGTSFCLGRGGEKIVTAISSVSETLGVSIRARQMERWG